MCTADADRFVETTPRPPVTREGYGLLARGRWRFPVWLVAAAAAVGLTIAVALAKDRWATRQSDQALSLAVLPLSNRSPDQQPDYFVDGMTEALTTDLASVRAIRVIARQSVMQYRETGKPASAIARELGVSALVEGAVHRSGQRIRVDIRLIDGATNHSLWASTYERDLSEALALQADISRAIVSELQLTVPASHGDAREGRRPSNPEAWDAYSGPGSSGIGAPTTTWAGPSNGTNAPFDLDPSSPLLFAGLADVYATLGPRDTPVSELIARGTAAANRAIGLDPRMGEPYAALGKLRAYNWDWPGAERNYRKAIELTPGYAPGRYWFGSFLANQGRCVEALEEAHEAERLDPVSLPGNMVIAGIEMKCDRVPRAVTRMKMILEFDPGFAQAYDYLGRAYLLQGDTTGAIAMFQRAQALTGGRATIEAALGFAYAMEGRKLEAEAIANTLAARHAKDKVLASAWSVAMVQAGLQNDEAALTWLEHAYADREEWLEALGADERFRGLHPTTGFSVCEIAWVSEGETIGNIRAVSRSHNARSRSLLRPFPLRQIP